MCDQAIINESMQIKSDELQVEVLNQEEKIFNAII